jgi:hypothetical protein
MPFIPRARIPAEVETGSLFLMDLVLPERYCTATNLQDRRRIQARQHGLTARMRLSIARRTPGVRIHAHRLIIVRRV